MSVTQKSDKQAIEFWRAYFDNFLADVSADHGETEQQRKNRRRRLEKDFEEWCRYYFPKYCYAPSAAFQKRASRRIMENPEYYEVRRWSRELAKDVRTMMETLYQVLTGVKRNILFISCSNDKACELLEPFRINLERNERIIADYGIQKLPGSWTYGDFVTTQGASFLAVGANQSPRGSRNEEVRPDKVIISDIDTDEDVRNEDLVKKKWEWFNQAVYPTRSISKPFQVCILGNQIAKTCFITYACEMADHVDTVNILDKSGLSSWPEKNTMEHIDRIRSKMPTRFFEAEYMNNPLTEGSVFKEITWGKVPPLSTLPFVVAYADPSTSNKSGGKKGSASYKSLFLVGYKEGRYYIYTGFLDKVSNAVFVGWFYGIKDYVGQKTQCYYQIENNTLQDPFYEQVFKPLFHEMGQTKGHIPIAPDTRKKPEKFARIEGNLEPTNRNGQLIFNEAERNNPNMVRLEEQFLLVSPGLAAPADGPDCIEGGKWIIDEKLTTQAAQSIFIHKRTPNTRRV